MSGWRHSSDSRPAARKEHTCELCGGQINRGAVHVLRRGFGDDGPTSFRMHIYCESVTRNWDHMDWESAVDPVDFHHYEIAEKGIADLNQPPTKEG